MPLSDEGRAQAQALARGFSHERFDRIVSSDLSRARDTALAIAAGRPVEIDARWREFKFGEWEGLRVDQVDAGVNARAYAPPGGETFDAVCERVREAIEALRELERVLVVTHAGPLHAMLAVLFGETRVRFEPASITTVRVGPDAAQLIDLGITVRQYAVRKQAGGPRKE